MPEGEVGQLRHLLPDPGEQGEVGGSQPRIAEGECSPQQPVPGDGFVVPQQGFPDPLGVRVGQPESDVVGERAEVGDVVVQPLELEQQRSARLDRGAWR